MSASIRACEAALVRFACTKARARERERETETDREREIALTPALETLTSAIVAVGLVPPL
jgi:hypothetical protein